MNNFFRTIFYIGFLSLLVGCGSTPSATTPGASTGTTPATSTGTAPAPATSTGTPVIDNVQYPSQPSGCGSECPPAFPIS